MSRLSSGSSCDIVRPTVESTEHLRGGLVLGVHLQRFFEMLPREVGLPTERVDASEIRVRVEVASIAGGLQSLLQPRDGVVHPVLFDQVRADVIVGMAKRRVGLDCRFALLDRSIKIALEAVRPPEERVRLRGGEEGQRTEIEVLRRLELAETLQDVRAVEGPPRRQLCDRQVVVSGVERSSRERLVHALRKMLIVVAYDAALPGVSQQVVAREQAAPALGIRPGRIPRSRGRVRDREVEVLPLGPDRLPERPLVRRTAPEDREPHVAKARGDLGDWALSSLEYENSIERRVCEAFVNRDAVPDAGSLHVPLGDVPES